MSKRRDHPSTGGLRLGSVAGIEVWLHWTWAIAASYIALVLAASVFPDEVFGLSTSAYYAMGVVTALLFFASLSLHELGHALQARREGMVTRRITLWMLGGLAESASPFERPGAEARVALAGPAVSAVLGVALVVAGRASGLPDSVATVLQWLGWANLLLLGFNLIPALPLDGGRVLRAALWRACHSHARATRDALRVARLLAIGMIAAGVVLVFADGGFSGVWVAFIGAFLLSSGAGERALAETRVALSGLRVAEVMTPDPIALGAGVSATELLTLDRYANHPAYPVVAERDRVLGFVSATSAHYLPARSRDRVTVAELMSRDDTVLDAGMPAGAALPALAANSMHRAAVVRGGALVGIVTPGDVLRAAARRSVRAQKAEGEGFEPSVDQTAHNGFRDAGVQGQKPLEH